MSPKMMAPVGHISAHAAGIPRAASPGSPMRACSRAERRGGAKCALLHDSLGRTDTSSFNASAMSPGQLGGYQLSNARCKGHAVVQYRHPMHRRGSGPRSHLSSGWWRSPTHLDAGRCRSASTVAQVCDRMCGYSPSLIVIISIQWITRPLAASRARRTHVVLLHAGNDTGLNTPCTCPGRSPCPTSAS